MFNSQLDEKIVSQYYDAMRASESNARSRDIMDSPYSASNDCRWIKDIQVSQNPLVIDLKEKQELETYFDTWVKSLYDFTEQEEIEARDVFVSTIKSTLGARSFKQWLKEQTQDWGQWRPRQEPAAYLHPSDKEGYGHGK